MSPRHTQPHPDPENQGMLFGVELVNSGETDASMQTQTTRLTDVEPDGIYPEKPAEPEVPIQDEAAVAALHKAVVTDNRHKGQLGKHSVLERENMYFDLEKGVSVIKLGDVLPDFGPVTRTNLAAAESHARQLQIERKTRRR